MMLRKPLLLLIVTGFSLAASAQWDAFVQEGEFGVAAGLGHYFGDLNTRANINRPKFTGGIFFRKQLQEYFSLKLAGNYARLGYSDVYSSNDFQHTRNLSFETDIYELALSGEFNFFKFQPGREGFNYTPYVSFGVGVFSYNPYAYLGGTKYYLRDLGTEGQGSSLYPDRQPYGTTAVCFPLAIGLKYAFSSNVNVFAELGYRFTTTDYLDDVSTTYAPDAFSTLPNGQASPAFLLQDRSYEYGQTLGIKGRQRGNSAQNDAYVLFQVGVSFNLTSYRCPKP